MPLSIHDLIGTTRLGTRLLSGSGGLQRPVRWAHVCELADPSEWLGEGDLLMSTGLGIPASPEDQRHYLLRLADAGLAGMMIGEQMQAPANLDALCLAAEERAFPVLLTRYGVPFAAVTRAIVEARQQQEYARSNALTQIYESARLSIQGLGLGPLLERLERNVQARLRLLNRQTLQPWAAGLEGLDGLANACGTLPRQHDGHQPLLQRCRVANQEWLLMALPSAHDCLLAAQGNDVLDYALLNHLAAVLSIELERQRAEAERHLRLGAQLLDELLQQRLPGPLAEQRLAAFGIDAQDARLALTRPAAEAPPILLQQLPGQIILRHCGEELLILHAEAVRSALMERTTGTFGLSNLLQHPSRFNEALREARLALAHSNPERPWVRYDQVPGHTPWLPQSLEQAERTFRQVLGPLADYDRQHGTPLLHTLSVFLGHNRSWIAAARDLHVHKQTLVYRIRRIEALCERALDNTEDVAILWFALRTVQVAGLDTSSLHGNHENSLSR